MLYSTVMNTEDRSFDIDELAALTTTPVRTIRFYIQEGLVPRPDGAGRGARYGAAHLETLLAIRRWQEQGLALGRIRQILAGNVGDLPPPRREPGSVEIWSHILLRPGVELRIEPSQAGLSPEQVRALGRAVLDATNRILDQEKETKE
jgi:DNA-binding transcriptional MerR regulator